VDPYVEPLSRVAAAASPQLRQAARHGHGGAAERARVPQPPFPAPRDVTLTCRPTLVVAVARAPSKGRCRLVSARVAVSIGLLRAGRSRRSARWGPTSKPSQDGWAW